MKDNNQESNKINSILVQYLNYEQLNELFNLNTSLQHIFNNDPTYIDLTKAQKLLSSSNKILVGALEKTSLKEKLTIDMLLLEQFNQLDTSKKYKYINSFD